MPETAKSVYYGQGNVGEAVVYQSDAPNIFDLIDSERDRAAKKQQAQKKKEAQDIEYELKETWIPVQEELLSKYNEYSKKTVAAHRDGSIGSVEKRMELEKDRQTMDMMSASGNQYQKALEDFQTNTKALGKMGLKVDLAQSKFLKSIKNDDPTRKGKYKPVAEWDMDYFENYDKDPENWDYATVSNNVRKALGSEKIKQARSEGGYIKTKTTEIPSYVRRLPNGDIAYDSNSEPIIDVDEEVVDLVKGTAGANVLVESILIEGRKYDPNYTIKDATKAFLKASTKIKQEESWSVDKYAFEMYKGGLPTKEEQQANNFWLQMNNLFHKQFDIINNNAGEVNGRTLQQVSSVLDNMVLGTVFDEDLEKKIDITGITLYDPEAEEFYIKYSNEKKPKPLNRNTIVNEVESFKNASALSAALTNPNFKWLDENNDFTLKPLTESGDFIAKESVKKSKSEAASVRESRGKVKVMKINKIPKIVEQLNKADKMGYWNDEEMLKLNTLLSELDTKGMVYNGKVKNPIIRINPKDDTEIQILDENGIVVSKEETNEQNIKKVLNLLEADIPSLYGDKSKSQQGELDD
jgi:hypothetical protein